MYLLTPWQKFVIIVATCLHYVISLDRSSDPPGSVKWNRAIVYHVTYFYICTYNLKEFVLSRLYTILSFWARKSLNSHKNNANKTISFIIHKNIVWLNKFVPWVLITYLVSYLVLLGQVLLGHLLLCYSLLLVYS